MAQKNKAIEACPVSHVEWVHRDRLDPNLYNPNQVAPPELELLIQSILEDGWTQPIVKQLRADGRFDIVDGFHRWKVSEDPRLWELYKGFVPTVTVKLDESHRMMSTIRHNRARGTHGILPMGKIITQLKAEGLSDEDICTRLGMEQEEIERLTDWTGMPEKVTRTKEEFSKAWNPKKKEK